MYSPLPFGPRKGRNKELLDTVRQYILFGSVPFPTVVCQNGVNQLTGGPSLTVTERRRSSLSYGERLTPNLLGLLLDSTLVMWRSDIESVFSPDPF